MCGLGRRPALHPGLVCGLRVAQPPWGSQAEGITPVPTTLPSCCGALAEFISPWKPLPLGLSDVTVPALTQVRTAELTWSFSFSLTLFPLDHEKNFLSVVISSFPSLT